MVATIELQVSAVKFAKAVISTLRQSPRCPPPAIAGLQLQRVRFQDAKVRHDQIGEFRVWFEPGPRDQGLGWTWIKGKRAQLAVDATLDVTPTATIAANPNTLIASEIPIDVTFILDLDCEPALSPGGLEITYTLAAIESPVHSLPAGVNAEEWVRDQLAAALSLKPLRYDLSASVPKGAQFWNAGLAIDATGSRLVVRGELATDSFNYRRWMVFRNGDVPDRLGANDWSIFIRAADLRLTLGMKVYDAIRNGLKDERHRLISVDCQYSPAPGRAVFTLTPFIDLGVLGTEAFPISLAISIDAQNGRIIVELDAYGIRDFVSSILDIVDTIIRILLPVVGWFVAAALNDAVGDALHNFSSMAAGTAGPALGQIPGAPPGATIEEFPGVPFKYRAYLPLATPGFVQGRINELITTADGMALAGSWSLLNFTEGDLGVDVSKFGWKPPGVACGASGERVLQDITINPKRYATLYAQVELTVSGSAPARLCAVSILSAPDPSTGLEFDWTATALPTTIEIEAPASLADLNPPSPIALEVRTTAGVFRVALPPPAALTPHDVELLRSAVRVKLAFCDAHILPPWFVGHGAFEVDWIVDPLVDPDWRDTRLYLAALEVTGLQRGSQLSLRDERGSLISSAQANRDGVARLATALYPGQGMPLASIRPASARLGRTAFAEQEAGRTTKRGVTVWRQRLEGRGALPLSRPALKLLAAPRLGPGRFLVAQRDACLLIDASDPARPSVERQWRAPGLRGVIETKDAMLVYGDAGLFTLGEEATALRDCCSGGEPVRDASASDNYAALVVGEQVRLFNSFGARIAEITPAKRPRTVLVLGSHLLIGCEGPLLIYDVVDVLHPRQIQSLITLAAYRIVKSGFDNSALVRRPDGTFVELEKRERGWAPAAVYEQAPWKAFVARSGRTVLHLNDGYRLNIYRLQASPQIVSPRGETKANAS